MPSARPWWVVLAIGLFLAAVIFALHLMYVLKPIAGAPLAADARTITVSNILSTSATVSVSASTSTSCTDWGDNWVLEVYRQGDPSNLLLNAQYMGNGARTYDVSGLEKNTAYNIESYCDAGNGSKLAHHTSLGNFTTLAADPTTPGAPTALTATGGDQRITLSWTAPADNGGAAITGYQYQQDGGSWQSAGTGTSYAVTGLDNSATHTYKVRAVNSVGGGTVSNAASATTAAATPTPTRPPTPTPTNSNITLSTATLSIGGDGANTLSLTWPAVSNLPNSTDWYYYLRVGSATGSTIASGKFADDSPNLTSASIALTRKLTPGGTYYVRILPYNRSPWNSQGFKEVTTTTGSACADSDAVDLGKLTGYDTNHIGSLQTTDCTIGGKSADLYKFQLSTARDTDFSLTPLTVFDSSGYSSGYSLRVRQTNLAGNSVGHATGLGNLDIDDVAVGASITYVVEVQRNGVGGGYGYSLNIAYGYVQPPTPTPAPTSTPRAQPNLDFRLVPHPEGFYYRVEQKYDFSAEGPATSFPLTVRSGNPAAFALAVNVGMDCPAAGNPPASVSLQNHNDTLYLTACAAGNNSTLSAIGSDGELLAQYSLYIGGGVAPPAASAPVTGPGGTAPPPPSDKLGIGIIIGAICTGVGVACDADLITRMLVTGLAAAVFIYLISQKRGRITEIGFGTAAAFCLVALMLGHLWVGFPLWIVGLAIVAVLAMGGVGYLQKGRQAG